MRIDLAAIPSDFKVKTSKIAGEDVFLVCSANQNPPWDSSNLIYRSSIWDGDGNPVSLGFSKFFNIGERDDLGIPDFNSEINILAKEDGACVIVSSYKDQLIVRTRETFSCVIHQNGQDVIDWVKSNELIKFYAEKTDSSLIFECLDPHNRIIVDNGVKLNLVLLAIVSHDDYSYLPQNAVDLVAAILKVDRPKRFNFSSLAEMRDAQVDLKNFEGWCIYFNNDQCIKKFKTEWYLTAHRLNYSLAKTELIEMLVESGATNRKELISFLAKDYDYETLSPLRTDWLFAAKEKLDTEIQRATEFAKTVESLDPKERALEIQAILSKNLWGFAFSILNSGEVNKKAKISRLKELSKEACISVATVVS